MAELSRGELLSWVNDLTNLNLPKVESMGTGSAHCLIINSIYGDLPLHKINFRAIHEYEYVHNFKVLQEAFVRHRIDRTVPVDRLIKLKFQDNLEFLQWMKKFWDAHFEGSGDKSLNVKKSTNSNINTTNSNNLLSRSASQKVNHSQSQAHAQVKIQPQPQPQVQSQSHVHPQSHPQPNVNALQLAALTKTITELKLSVDEMEKERDFYFNKLRDIEILTQKVSEPAITGSLFFKQITEILYTTEDGFEIPQESSKANESNGVTA